MAGKYKTKVRIVIAEEIKPKQACFTQDIQTLKILAL